MRKVIQNYTNNYKIIKSILQSIQVYLYEAYQDVQEFTFQGNYVIVLTKNY